MLKGLSFIFIYFSRRYFLPIPFKNISAYFLALYFIEFDLAFWPSYIKGNAFDCFSFGLFSLKNDIMVWEYALKKTFLLKLLLLGVVNYTLNIILLCLTVFLIIEEYLLSFRDFESNLTEFDKLLLSSISFSFMSPKVICLSVWQ